MKRQLSITIFTMLFVVFACTWTRCDSEQQSGYCSFPDFLQDTETADTGLQRKTWISRTLFVGSSDSWTRRTIVTVSGGLMRVEHRLHASCRCSPLISRLRFCRSESFSGNFRRKCRREIHIFKTSLPSAVRISTDLGTFRHSHIIHYC